MVPLKPNTVAKVDRIIKPQTECLAVKLLPTLGAEQQIYSPEQDPTDAKCSPWKLRIDT